MLFNLRMQLVYFTNYGDDVEICALKIQLSTLCSRKESSFLFWRWCLVPRLCYNQFSDQRYLTTFKACSQNITMPFLFYHTRSWGICYLRKMSQARRKWSISVPVPTGIHRNQKQRVENSH